MRRFVSLAILVFFSVPFGASLAGCGHKIVTVYCNGGDSGPIVGQVKSITLSPQFATFGESVDYGQIGNPLSASAVDCKGTTVSVAKYTYATSDTTFSYADIDPSNGRICGGSFNRNTGAGIPDFTTCTAPVSAPANAVAYVTATADGAVSNAIPVYIHPTVTSIVIGNPTPIPTYPITGYQIGTNTTTFTTASAAPPTSDVITLSQFGTSLFFNGQIGTVTSRTANSFTLNGTFGQPPTAAITESGAAGENTSACASDPLGPATNCCPTTTGAVLTAPAYNGLSCLSQGATAQLTARAYRNGTTNVTDNITCQIGHLQYAAQNSSVLTIDQNGIATAQQPGSTVITGSVSSSGSGGAAGFFSTCPPASITLQVPNTTATSVNVNVNTQQPLNATVIDTKGVTLSGVALTFNSTTPTTIPAGSGTVTPTFPGSATITAECLPPTCNSAPYSQTGFNGNGKPITSNGVQITAPGTSASVIYIASTQSQYFLPVDFATNQQGTLVKLPYTPNSMVISNDGNTLYFGSSIALMIVSAANNQLQSSSLTIPGTVISVSPNNVSAVVTDSVRKTVSLVSSSGTVTSSYGGVGTRAQWSPDSSTVYITGTNNQLLVHSDYNGWYSLPTNYQYVDVAVLTPSVGAFFATSTAVTEGRTYCSTTTQAAPATSTTPPAEANALSPVANDTLVQTDRIATTNDGNHILGATTANVVDITVSTGMNQPLTPVQQPNGPLACTTAGGPVMFNTSFTQHALPAITPTAITGIVPASNSALAFVTYTGTGGILPEYIPGTGAVTSVPLSGGATAPVSGVFATDNRTFYTGTSGDNQVHLITVTGTSATDTSVIAPKLPDVNGNPAVPDLLVQKPKKTTT